MVKKKDITITVSGPVASGKSTVARTIKEELERHFVGSSIRDDDDGATAPYTRNGAEHNNVMQAIGKRSFIRIHVVQTRRFEHTPWCPKCESEMVIVERMITESKCDSLEGGDPSLPIPGEQIDAYVDDEFHPFYRCNSCRRDWTFSLQPLMPAIAGRHNGVWDSDLIQFARLISEINANVPVGEGELADMTESMDLPSDKIDELFARACEFWESVKEAIRIRDDKRGADAKDET